MYQRAAFSENCNRTHRIVRMMRGERHDNPRNLRHPHHGDNVWQQIQRLDKGAACPLCVCEVDCASDPRSVFSLWRKLAGRLSVGELR